MRVVVLRVPGSPPRADPVFYLEGGPGGAATEAASWFPPAIYWERELVLVDQRGTGGSHPLTCPELRDAPAAEAVGRLLACLGRLRADPAQYGTVAAMRDVDAVRAALGYRRINLIGISYGTVAAQAYLRLYPGRVRSVVLDSGLLLGNSLSQRAVWEQRALDLIAARCAADQLCARRFPAWYSALAALLQRLRSQPVEVTVGGKALTLDALLTESTIVTLTRSAWGAARVPLLVSRAVAGDYQMLAKTASDLSAGGNSPTLMTQEILCNESWAQYDRAAAAAAAMGTYVEDIYAAELADTNMRAMCDALPRWTEPPDRWLPVRSPVPVLALAGEADPVLPAAAMAGVGEAMPNSRLIVVPGQGHGLVYLPCVRDLVARFLDTRAPRRLDARCVRTITPPDWVTSWP